MLFELWKIVFDYIAWVEQGGEDIYGCYETAKAWLPKLLA